jgi:hypothetical protein
MTHVFPGAGTIQVDHVFPTPYVPSMSGAIDHIDYSEDRIQFNQPFPGAAIGGYFFLRQSGVRRIVTLTGGTFTGTAWETATLSGLRASNFSGADFSAQGAPIEFGFVRWNSTGGILTTTHGIDNWRVTICR